MQKLSLRKQMSIIRLYLSALSYDEIAAKAAVSKGTVANVVADLRAGRILDVQEPVEQLELLRELAIELRRLKLTPGEAVAGITTISHLQELQVEPADIQRWAAMCQEMAADEIKAQAFVRAALNLERVRERTGLSAEALEEKVHGLEKEVARLEPLAQELRGCQLQLDELEKRRQALASDVEQLEKRHEPLRKDVIQNERREAELSRRIQQLEHRAQAADERLAAARTELRALAGLGLSPDELPGFGQRLAAVAQRHGIEPGALRERLLHELEELEAGLGLESLVEMRRHELDEIERATAKARGEQLALDPAVQQLRQEKAGLHAAIAEGQRHARRDMQATAKIAKDAVAKLREDLGNGVGETLLEVRSLRSEALELGQELGRYNAVVEANQWLQTLVALVRGDGAISAGDVRVVALAVLRGLQGWLQQNQGQILGQYLLATLVDSAIRELERWTI